ncbi:MAG: nicotinate (nicotinamide) nucleotide adenylyltransferase [Planctomycetaceae bacterium]
MARRLGIFGGSFDPIHRGHLALLEAARKARTLERVFVVPAGRPPHKRDGSCAPFEDRLAMVRLALAGRTGVEPLDWEGLREGPSYTIDTVEELARREGGAGLELLVGADMLADLPRWHRAAELASLVTVVAFARPGTPLERSLAAFRAAFPGREPVLVPAPLLDISATEIRRRLGAGEAVRELLPPGVEAYARSKGLYGTGG